jgi:hypothetical protein
LRGPALLGLLIAYHPYNLHLDEKYDVLVILGADSLSHPMYPVVWSLGRLDTPLLLTLVVWAIFRFRTARPSEQIVYHWLLFVCVLWAACGIYDFGFGKVLLTAV